nr:integrase family protein [uncultured Cohaesibacter sp.]
MKTTQKLTDKLIQSLSTNKDRIQITDQHTAGLKIRVTRNGKKTFCLMKRDKTGKNRTITLGHYPEISLKMARELAHRKTIQINNGTIAQSSLGYSTIQNSITLRDLLDEVEPAFAKTKKGWRPRGKEGTLPEMRSTIECVFKCLLDTRVEAISEERLWKVAHTYQPIRPLKGKTTANGQVSKAMSYLSSVLNWAAHRGRQYKKCGAGRLHRLDVADMSKIVDPSNDDPSITGRRERVLQEGEIAAIYPLLTYPPHPDLRRPKIPLEKDFGPIALRFLLLTLSRREEVTEARWEHIDFKKGIWFKPNTKSKEAIRTQTLPLSVAALELLRSLPGSDQDDPSAFVFPNRDGGKLGNWGRISKQVQEASKTSGWTRHDLRRTGSTLLKELMVPLHVIDEILDHKNPLSSSDTSGALINYLVTMPILTRRENPIVSALNILQEAFEAVVFEQSADLTKITSENFSFIRRVGDK